MMKKLKYLFLFIGIFGSAQIYIIEDEVLNGKIKSVDLSVIEYKNEAKPVLQETYDIKGRPTLIKKYSDNSYLRSEERNEYSANQIITTLCESCGKSFDNYFAKFLIKENQKSPYAGYLTNDNSVRRKIYKTIDKNGNVILEKLYSPEGYLFSIKKSKYNISAKLLSKESFDDENKLQSQTTIIYNKKNNPVEEIRKYERKPDLKKTYQYDGSGRLILEKEMGGDRTFENSYEYIKEKDTLKTFKYSLNSSGEKNLNEIELNYPKLKGKVQEIRRISDKKVYYRAVSEYDERKKLISQKFYNNKNEINRETTFLYDKNGNWNELNYAEEIMIRYNNEEPKKEIRKTKYIREISYY